MIKWEFRLGKQALAVELVDIEVTLCWKFISNN